MDWKRLFRPHILDRGYNYYCENAVVDMEVSKDVIKADVIGNEYYEVEIVLDNNEIIDMYCSCPYAKGQNNCKHMAAVLYEWNKGKNEEDLDEYDLFSNYMVINDNLIKDQKQKREAIQELIDKADIDVLKTYLNEILINDEKLLVRFKSMIEGNDKLSINIYKRQVDDITNKYLGRDRFIGYYEAMDFIYELMEIYDVDIRRMIDAKQYMKAFELMNYIFVLVGNVDIDDSDGGTGILAHKTYDLWLEILKRVTDEVKRDIFKWFTTHLDGSIIDYLEDYIEKIIMEEFQENEYIPLKKKFIEDMLDNADDSTPEWSFNYYIGKWALRYISLLEKEGNNKEYIDEFCANFWDNSDIRRYCINKSIIEKDYAKALKILDESLKLDEGRKGLISEYSVQIKDIYLQQNDKVKYIEQLWKLVLDYEAGNIKYYRELKRQYTEEEWIQEREKIFEELPKYAHVERFYREEKLYDRLLQYTLESDGWYAIQEYGSILVKEYPEQMLAKYKFEINKMATHATSRKRYREMVAVLRYMQEIKGGIELVDDIVAEWKIKYRTRRAMMEELSKL